MQMGRTGANRVNGKWFSEMSGGRRRGDKEGTYRRRRYWSFGRPEPPGCGIPSCVEPAPSTPQISSRVNRD